MNSRKLPQGPGETTAKLMAVLVFVCLFLFAREAAAVCPDPLPLDTVCLEWVAPTENVDGTPLTDLAGFEVFWALTSGDFVQARKFDIPDSGQVELSTPAGALNIPSPGPGGGTVMVFFVMTAYDTGVIRDATINCTGDPNDDANDPGNEVNCRSVSAFSNEIGEPVVFGDPEPEAPRLLRVIINVRTS